jgi:hypothetical protein
MRKNRFSTRFSSGVFVIALAAGGVLLLDGVSNAVPPANTLQVIATTTTLTTSPPDQGAEGHVVTLTAKIMPSAATGKVQFKDGTANLGDAVLVSNGTASGSTSTLAPGTHSLTAVFTPADPAAYSPSKSEPVTFVVNASTGSTTTPRATILTQSTGSMNLVPPLEVKFAAKLTEAASGAPVVGRRIDFSGDDQALCQAFTDVYGWASCSAAENLGTRTVTEVLAGYHAKFSGDREYGPSTQQTSATIGTAPPKP